MTGNLSMFIQTKETPEPVLNDMKVSNKSFLIHLMTRLN